MYFDIAVQTLWMSGFYVYVHISLLYERNKAKTEAEGCQEGAKTDQDQRVKIVIDLLIDFLLKVGI